MIGLPFLVLGILLVLSALLGARVGRPGRGAAAAFVLSPLHPAAWYATFAILAGSWVELVAFVVVTSLFSSGASLLVVGIGIVVIGLGIEASRVVARVERRRAAIADARPLLPHLYRPYGRGLQDLLRAVFTDLNRWRDVVYVFVAFPLTLLELVVVVTLWTAALVLVAVPPWYAIAGPAGFGAVATPIAPVVPGTAAFAPGWVALVAGVVGVVLLPVAASVARGLMTLHRAVMSGLLCDSEQRRLERRVEVLEGSRRAVLDVEASELRRIERDLHDGAQQRLVALAIDLGLAAERIDSDPDSARALVVDARDQARQALAELRDLVRGIAPAILLDRGLVAALGSIAGRCPVPTVVESMLPQGARLPDAAERAAYFVVAEALANVAKHASATRCEVRVRPDGPPEAVRLIVEVRDDGAGGARIVPGGGLAGLANRVQALDGSIAVQSPEGGPTVIRAVLPVGSVRPADAALPAAAAEGAGGAGAAGAQEPR